MLVGTMAERLWPGFRPHTTRAYFHEKVEVSKSIYTRGFRDREAAATEDWVSGCTMRPGG